jgi:signal transduction histidine kinase
MRLTKFIAMHHDAIIEEWIAFAKTLHPWADGLDEKVLRDHAEELLTAVVVDMEAPQSSAEKSAKSKGHAAEGSLGMVGHKHAAQRMYTGFNLDQLVSEYRALRASVLRLWAKGQGDSEDDVTRFNEAIDESLTEATVRYSQMLDRTKDQFLGILGHDLRNPLSAVIMGATVLTKSESIDLKQSRIATRILNSAERMNRLVSDLLDLTRTRLGSGIPITPKRMDLKSLCQQIIAELEAVHPDCHVRFASKGELLGDWDSDRLAQVISNLVANALQHGPEEAIVRVIAEELGDAVRLQVHNEGTIPESVMKKIFEPMVHAPNETGDRNRSGLGLGLYIAREVAVAHGGSIEVSSSKKDGTTFTVSLPRHLPHTHDITSRT